MNIALDIALADIGAWGLAAIGAALLGLRIVAKQLRIAAPPKEAVTEASQAAAGQAGSQ